VEGDGFSRRLGEFVIEPLIELDALCPGERFGVESVVGADEGGDRALRRREVGQFGPLQALLAEDGEPGSDEGEPGGMDRQPVEGEATGAVVDEEGHFRRGVHADRIEDEMDHLAPGHLAVQGFEEFEELGAAVAAADEPGHRAGIDAEGGEQSRRAVADGCDLATGGPLGGDGLAGGGWTANAVAQRAPGLLVDAEGRAVGRRMEFALDDGNRFRDEPGVAFFQPGVKDGPGGRRAPGG
jgi:hypothetical protein